MGVPGPGGVQDLFGEDLGAGLGQPSAIGQADVFGVQINISTVDELDDVGVVDADFLAHAGPFLNTVGLTWITRYLSGRDGDDLPFDAPLIRADP